MMDLGRRLPQQEHAARDQDEVADREGGLERRFAMRAGGAGQAQVEHRHRHPGDPRDGRQQHEPQAERQPDAEPPRRRAPRLGQLVRQERDEDQIVDAEHHLHHDQRGERGPGGGIGGEAEDRHRRDLWQAGIAGASSARKPPQFRRIYSQHCG